MNLKALITLSLTLTACSLILSCSESSKVSGPEGSSEPQPFCVLEVDIAPKIYDEFVPYRRYGIDTSQQNFMPFHVQSGYTEDMDELGLTRFGRFIYEQNIRDDASHWFYEYQEENGQIVNIHRTTWPEWDSQSPSNEQDFPVSYNSEGLVSGYGSYGDVREVSKNHFEVRKRTLSDSLFAEFIYNNEGQLVNYNYAAINSGNYRNTQYTYDSNGNPDQTVTERGLPATDTTINFANRIDSEGRIIATGTLEGSDTNFTRLISYQYNCEHPMFYTAPDTTMDSDS